VFPHLGSTDIPFSSYVELMGRDKWHNSSHAYCQVKGWSKKSYEIFSNDFVKDFWNGMIEGKKMGSYKKDIEVAMFFPSQNIDFPFLFEETLRAFLFLSLLFQYIFSLFFYAPSLWGHGDFDDKRGEKHSSKISFQKKWNGMAKPELWKWGSCGYIGGGRIFEHGVMHANIIGEASKKMDGKSFSKNFKTHNGHIP
jgi:hypothetical protein